MSPILLLALAAASGGETPQSPPQGAAEPVVRIYDLRSATPSYDTQSDPEQSLLLPPSDRHWDLPQMSFEDLYEVASSEVVVDVLGQVFGDDLRYEGREISLTGDGMLLVLAPPEVQTRVAAALTILEEAMGGTVEVTVDVLELSQGVEMPAAGVVDEAEAQRLVAQLPGESARHRSYTLRVAAGRTARLDEMRKEPALVDYDVEIAQSAVTFDPQFREAADGLRLHLRGVPTADGLFLSVLLLESEILGGLEQQPLEVLGRVWNEKGQVDVGAGLALQKPRTFVRSIAFDTYLPNGKAAIFTSECHLAAKESRQAVVLRRTRGGPTAFTNRQVPGTTRRLIAVNSELFGLPRTSMDGPFLDEAEGQFRWDPRLVAQVGAQPSLFLFDWMKSRFSVWRRMGPWALAVTDPAWDDDAAGALQRLVAGWDPGASLVGLEARLHAPGGLPMRWHVPVLSGSACGVRLGTTTVALFDYGTEVAQHAAALDPQVATVLEGLTASVSTARGGSGALTLDVHAVAQIVAGQGGVEPGAGGPRAWGIDLPRLARLEVDERLGAVAQPEGAVQFRLGDTGQGQGRGLQLELVVR